MRGTGSKTEKKAFIIIFHVNALETKTGANLIEICYQRPSTGEKSLNCLFVCLFAL